MSVISKLNGFLNRHRNKIIVSGVLITGTLFLTRYAQKKLTEWHEKEMIDFLEKNNREQHFKNLGRTCNDTVLNLFKTVNEAICNELSTDEIIEKIKKYPDLKIELWNQLKVLIFSKACCLIYFTVMFVVTMKIQLSIVGGYLYKNANSIDTELQEKYLRICENFLNSGLKKLSNLIKIECEKILKTISLKQQMKLSDLEALFWSIQIAVTVDKDNPTENMKYYILSEIPYTNDTYEKLMQDITDILDSDETKALVTHCINRGFLLLSEQITDFFTPTDDTIENDLININDIKKPLARLLPIINGLFTKKSFPDIFLQQLMNYEKLQTFSANVFESFLQ